MFESEYIIEATYEGAARRLEGDIIEENNGDSWGYEIVSIEVLERSPES